MSLGHIFLVVAAVFFFLAAVGSIILPNPTAWGLFFLALGILCAGWQPWTWGPK